MVNDSPLWRQFRRVLLGAVVESLLEAGVGVDFPTITVHFEDTSAFRVPRFDNYMRFTGVIRARVLAPPSAGALATLQAALRRIWPELLSIIELPIGDTLTNERMVLDVAMVGDVLTVRFDLAAD